MLEGQEIFENQMEFLNIISDLIETPTKKSAPKVINKGESAKKIPLPKELSEPIWALLEQKPVGETIEEQNTNYINGLKKAWDLLPSDKEKYSECFLVLQTIIDASIKRKDYQTLKEYRKFIDEYCPKAENYQSSNEFILGRVAFELGELSEALEFFKSADKKSKGRIFKGKDPKYKAFLENEV